MIALSTGSLYTYGLARVFELAAQVGYDGIEVLVDQRPDTRDPDYLRRLSAEHDLPIVALHSPFARNVPGWPSDQMGRLERTVALAQALEVPVVVTHLPYRLAGLTLEWHGVRSGRLLLPLPWFQRGPYYHLLAEGGLAEMEGKFGVAIAVENMPDRRILGTSLPAYWFNHPERMADFPHVTLDTTHVGTWGADLLAVYEQLKGRIVHVHLSNFDGREHRLPESGRLPLGELLQRLARDGYAGAVSLEVGPEVLEAEDEARVRAHLRRAVRFCREQMG